MKRNPSIAYIVLISVTFIFNGACTLPANVTPNQPAGGETPEVIYTSAAQTVVALLTQSAATTPPPPPPPPASPTSQVLPSQTPSPTDTLVPSPTSTEESSPTPEFTATPQDTPTPTAAEDPRLKFGEPGWSDKFATENNWSLYEDDHINLYIKNDRLVMIAFNPDQWDGWALSWPQTQDFYLEMTARTDECAGLDRWGLIFRAKQDASEGYLLGFSCDGRYSMRKWDGEKYTKYVNWTDSPYINAGSDQSNRLGVWADGDKFKLYANGNLLTEVKDDSYDSGSFGVYIGSAETKDFTVYVEEVAYWDLTQ